MAKGVKRMMVFLGGCMFVVGEWFLFAGNFVASWKGIGFPKKK